MRGVAGGFAAFDFIGSAASENGADDAVTQDRLDELMGRNTEGKLTLKEHRELERLVEEAELLSLDNARLLAGHSRKSKTAALPRPARSRRPA